MDKELKERYPLCYATHQATCCDMTEKYLEQTMSFNDKVRAKLDAGIEPTPIEEKFCSLPYDLPGEIWRGIPGVEQTHFISNKRRFKYFTKDGKVVYTAQRRNDGSMSIYALGSRCFRSNVLVYNVFNEDEVRPIDEKHLEQKLRNDAIKRKLNSGESLSGEEISFCTLLQDLPGEEWRPVVGAETKYLVSNLGRVKGIKTNMVLKVNVDKLNYLRVSPSYVSKEVSDLVHRLVAQAFIPKTEEDIRIGRDDVNHINGNKHDNRVVNLEWCTQEENVHHAFDTGLLSIGFTQKDYDEAVRLYTEENRSSTEIAKIMGFATSTICHALFGKRYVINNTNRPKKHKHKTVNFPIRFDDPRSSMTLDTILEIKVRLKHRETAKSVAQHIGIYPQAIYNIRNNRRYAEVHLEDYPERVKDLEQSLGYA